MLETANWLNNPEYVKLVDFLVEKTKEVRTVLCVQELAKEFKKQSNSELSNGCLESRIGRFRRIIISLSHLDAETKVKLHFGLSAPMDYGFLRELRKEADVTVDNLNRITHYKKNGGGLELWGRHSTRKASHNQILEFLAKKVEETSGIMELSWLAEQFKEETRSSQNVVYLQMRIREATKQIYESELFDEEMKVRMMFATRGKVEDYALEELRKNAIVVVDKKNRIEEYKRNDGSLHLNKKECEIKSRKRFSIASSFNNQYDMEDRHDDDYSFDISYQYDNDPEVKLEPFDGPLNMNLSRGAVIDDGDDFVEEIAAPTDNFVAPKYEEMEVKLEEAEMLIVNDPIDTEVKEFKNGSIQQNSTSSEDVKKDHTPLNLILESLHDFIDTLNLPILTAIQKRIESKLKECKNKNSINQMISNTGIYYSLQLCLLSVNKCWGIEESVESFRLETFNRHLRHSAVTLKLPSLIEYQGKSKAIIGEFRGQNKFIPVTSIRSALQSVIDDIIDS